MEEIILFTDESLEARKKAFENIPKWQLRQDHHEDLKTCLKETKCVDSKGQIRRMCPDFWKMFEEMGHDYMDFEKCSCQKFE